MCTWSTNRRVMGVRRVTVAQKIKKVVDERGIKYTAISLATGIHIDAISRSFNGKRKLLGDELVAICKFLHLELDDVS